jgi:hypothetical protein
MPAPSTRRVFQLPWDAAEELAQQEDEEAVAKESRHDQGDERIDGAQVLPQDEVGDERRETALLPSTLLTRPAPSASTQKMPSGP